MLQAVELVVLAAVHVAAGIGRPDARIADGEHHRRRTQLELVHPVAIVAAILVPPAALVLGPVLAATVAEQEAVLVVEELHLVVAPPADRMQRRPHALGHGEARIVARVLGVEEADGDGAELVFARDRLVGRSVGRHVEAERALVELELAEQLQEVPVRSGVVLVVAPELDVDQVALGPAQIEPVPLDDETRRRALRMPVVDVHHLHFGRIAQRIHLQIESNKSSSNTLHKLGLLEHMRECMPTPTDCVLGAPLVGLAVVERDGEIEAAVEVDERLDALGAYRAEVEVDRSGLADRDGRVEAVAPLAVKVRAAHEARTRDVHLLAAQHVATARPYLQDFYLHNKNHS